MEAKVDETLGYIGGGDPGGISELAQIDNALMRHQAFVARVEDREVFVERGRQVVCAQYCMAGCGGEALAAGHCQVSPRNRKHAC